MKIQDNRANREKQKDELNKKENELRRKKEENKKSKIIPQIKFISDWRIEQEYNSMENISLIFAGQENEYRSKFLSIAIENRKNLNEIVIESYEPNMRYPIEVSIECDDEIIETLKKEAGKLGLTYDEYVRGIYYTTALEINNKKKESIAKAKLEAKEFEVFPLGDGRFINQRLRRKLVEKYGEIKYDSLFLMPEYGYTDMLIDLAEEYFGLDKSRHITDF